MHDQVVFNSLHSSGRKHGATVHEEEQELKDIRTPDVTPDFGHTRRRGNDADASSGPLPQTVQELENVVASNCPIFYFHPDEQYVTATST